MIPTAPVADEKPKPQGARLRLRRMSFKEGTRGRRWFFDVRRGEDGPDLVTARFEGYVASGARMAGIGLNADEDSSGLTFSVRIPHIAAGYLTVGSWPLSKAVRERLGWELPDVNVFSLSFHDRTIWWELWHDQWGWSSGTPRWRSGYFKWWDTLVGKSVYSTEVIEGPTEVTIPLPEGGYRARMTLKRCTWSRARWWPQVLDRFDMTVLSRPGPDGPYVPDDLDPERPNGYLPIPGKGSEAYNCGPDGTFGMCAPAKSIEEAIGIVVGSVLRERRKRGASPDYAEAIT